MKYFWNPYKCMKRKITWNDLLIALSKIPRQYMELPVIIGGGECFEYFYGFDLVGPSLLSSTPLTGINIFNILKSLTPSILDEYIALNPDDIVLESTLYGDLDEISIGPLRTHCIDIPKRIIFPIEDFGDNFTKEQIDKIYKQDKYINSELLEPETRLVIQTCDGSIVLNDKEAIIV